MTAIARKGAKNFVGGDWGTSHLRLFLCDPQGSVLDSRDGPGAVDAGGHFSDVLESLAAHWEESLGTLPAVLCGMVGSSIGWVQVPYVVCPAIPEEIADACVGLRGGSVHIVPGLSCRNRFDAPDFLRGEETQILGALQLVPALRRGRCLLCLPGTHTKWALLEDGVVCEFLTAPTGELYAIVCEHSVLVGKHACVETKIDSEAFKNGLQSFNAFTHAQLLHRLFECRSRQLSGELRAPSAYLSGLLIASDVHGALQVLASSVETRLVYVIGSSNLAQLYAAALACHGYEAFQVEGVAASQAGLAQVHRWLSKAGSA
jgi:2-dehydro-3-deoxygalactonokinase